MGLCCAIWTPILLGACDGPTTVIAWPGMPVAEFNRLNHGKARMRESDSDWIGINSPVTLVLRQGGDRIAFSETRAGGGMQLASSRQLRDGRSSDTARITTIDFTIGEPMGDVGRSRDAMAADCATLARMAGVSPRPVADAATIGRALHARDGTWREVPLCSGEGARLRFSISAAHYTDHWKHGGDFSRATFRGHLGLAGVSGAGGRPTAAAR